MERPFDLPYDLIIFILDLAIAEQGHKSGLSLLLLSKRTHKWVLTRIYHTLELSPDHDSNASVNREVLLRSANPASLRLVRRVKCGSWSIDMAPMRFNVFYHLTHLALWAHHSLHVSKEHGILSLRLEELITWSPTDRSAILESRKFDSPLCTTLKRFGSFDNGLCSEEDVIRLDYFQNITHILFCFHGKISRFPKMCLRKHLDREGFRLGLFTPAFVPPNTEQFEVILRYLESLQNSKVVIAKSAPPHVQTTNPAPHFWSDQKQLWRAGERASARNSHLKTITFIENLTQ
ncbi:hypothetical protein DL96DRAFT_1627410 [Flagelloscypha sp. PMI_526]|nr:hypothetical protein DL96DRAFT_1627410 [Flagelloscypha sp. PMI_526]